MLHVVGFVLFTFMLLSTAAGLAFMLASARDRIETALRSGRRPMRSPAAEPLRVRVLRTVQDRRFMPTLRAAA